MRRLLLRVSIIMCISGWACADEVRMEHYAGILGNIADSLSFMPEE